jgi:uncharacterized membrane protein
MTQHLIHALLQIKTRIATGVTGTNLEPFFYGGDRLEERTECRMRSYISTESVVLTLICLADMLSTLVLVTLGYAAEQNPLMAACLQRGPATFVLVKALSFIPFVVTIEWYRRKKPVFARNAGRAAILSYLIVYIALTLRANWC